MEEHLDVYDMVKCTQQKRKGEEVFEREHELFIIFESKRIIKHKQSPEQKTCTPFCVKRNIMSYHRQKVIVDIMNRRRNQAISSVKRA